MPIRFRCPQCDRKLKARDDHVGRQLHCPSCNQVLTVPADSELSRIIAEGQSSDDTSSDPFAELIVYDDEIVYETDPRSDGNSAPTKSSKTRWVGVSRRLIYMYALLLPIIGCGALLFGYLFGRTHRTPLQPQVAAKEHRVLITGQLQWEGQTKQIADRGAVVIAIPDNFEPPQKLAGDKFGPQKPVPSRDSEVVRTIEEWSGGYARTNDTGEFELYLFPGKYHLLFVSGQAKRRAVAEPKLRDDLAAIGQFFSVPEEIIGPQRYHWTLEELSDESRLSYEFVR